MDNDKLAARMKAFWQVATPTTLASLIADLQNADEWTDEEDALHKICSAELVAIVGQDEAIDLLKNAGALGL